MGQAGRANLSAEALAQVEARTPYFNADFVNGLDPRAAEPVGACKFGLE